MEPTGASGGAGGGALGGADGGASGGADGGASVGGTRVGASPNGVDLRDGGGSAHTHTLTPFLRRFRKTIQRVW